MIYPTKECYGSDAGDATIYRLDLELRLHYEPSDEHGALPGYPCLDLDYFSIQTIDATSRTWVTPMQDVPDTHATPRAAELHAKFLAALSACRYP